MNKNLIKKTLVFGIIILFIGAIIIPSISGNVSKMNEIASVKTRDINNAIQTKERNPLPMSTTDWWPQFRHDSGNTGCTTSIAPNTNQLSWKESVPDEFYFASPIIYNDRLYISSGWWLYSNIFDVPKITDISMLEVPDFTEILTELTTFKDEYYGAVYCLDADKGTELWNYSLYAPNDPFIDDNKVYVTDFDYNSYGSSLFCLDAENGNQIWNKPFNGLVTSQTTGADDKIFLGTLDYYSYGGSLNCFDFDGNTLWTYPFSMYELMWFSAPAYCDGKVYFLTIDLYSYYYGTLYCLDAKTGQYIWSQPIFTFFFWLFFNTPSPVCKDGNVYVTDLSFYTYSTSLKCFDADTGSLSWEYPFDGFSLFPGTPAVSQDSVYITCFDYYSYYNFLYRISTDGTLVWKVLIPGYTYWLFPSYSPVCSPNKVIICSIDYYVYTSVLFCYEIENGNLLWSYSLDDGSVANPSIADERVYMTDFTGNIYAFEDVLKINRIAGGILRVRAVIKNIGAADLTNISWSIDVVGGMFNMNDKHAYGNISTLQGGKFKIVRAFPVMGLGNVEIEVKVSMPGSTPIKKNLNGLVLGLIVIIKS